jgi:hypothetical protein
LDRKLLAKYRGDAQKSDQATPNRSTMKLLQSSRPVNSQVEMQARSIAGITRRSCRLAKLLRCAVDSVEVRCRSRPIHLEYLLQLDRMPFHKLSPDPVT